MREHGSPRRPIGHHFISAALLGVGLTVASAPSNAQQSPSVPASAPDLLAVSATILPDATDPNLGVGLGPSQVQGHDQVAEPEADSEPNAFRKLALVADAGFPDGAILSAAYRPRRWVRLAVGAGSNSVSPGLRAGATLLPFGVGPSATVEGGWYFEGDANGIAAQIAGSGYQNNAMLSSIGYRYVNLHVGLDFGQKNFTFFVHGGMSYVRADLHGANEALGTQAASSTGNGTTTLTITSDPVVTAFLPSFKLGFVVYVL